MVVAGFILIILCVVGTVFAVFVDRPNWHAKDKHGFWYDVAKDFIGPFMIAVAVFVLTLVAEHQKTFETENQNKAAALQEIFTKGNGPDVAFFTGIGDQMTWHLQRYQKYLEMVSKRPAAERTSFLDENALFEEKAIYFYYGMFRTAQTDFIATKGYVLYPRIWMEEAFERLIDHLVGCLSADQLDLGADAHEEAALYHYFGTGKASYSSATASEKPTGRDLLTFAQMLKTTHTGPAKVADDTPSEQIVAKGFDDFQSRLRNLHNAPNPDEIIAIVEAIIGLDDYAFNTLFAEWYHQPNSQKTPTKMPTALPPEFLPYPLARFEQNNASRTWADERRCAWNEIWEVLPAELKEAQSPTPCSITKSNPR